MYFVTVHEYDLCILDIIFETIFASIVIIVTFIKILFFTLITSTVTDSLCNAGAFSNPNAVRDCPFNLKGAWFLSRIRKFYSYAALLFLKLFSPLAVMTLSQKNNTNNVNKTCALVQTTGGKDEPNIVFNAEILASNN
jgi:hypothetical protein